MQTKHTPGPWKVRVVEAGNSSITGAKVYDHIIEPLNILARRSMAKECVDAALIAAAPELLEAVKAALPHIKSRGEAGDEHIVYAQIKQVIAKAEGK